MNIIDIIENKKNNKELTYDELAYAFLEYLNGTIKDYQMSALLMAICINGMNLKETLALTDIFIKSGDTYDLSNIENTVDKHSTGGVGDSTTLIVGPMCASLSMHMAKMSGRGLGLTGGTIDKLESIPNFNVNLTEEEFLKNTKEVGFSISSQTKNLVPLDKIIYALRDVTGTCESIPLIASSIMSKKIAAGAKNILIDVKYGSGALMKNINDAKKLCEYLESIGTSYNRNVKTILSDMNTPLSYAIGNSLEVLEAINVLHGKKCRLYDESVNIVANLYSMSFNKSLEEGREKAIECINNGSAIKKFYEFVLKQGGNIKEIKIAKTIIPVKSKQNGKVANVDALGAARLAAKLGSSKMTLDDEIDYEAGIVLNVKINDIVKENDTLFNIYTNKIIDFDESDFDFIEIDESNMI